MTAPAYNHTRGDSPLTPCPECQRYLEIEVVARGTPDQRERWAANLLPEDELLVIARGVLFAPFEGLPRYNARSNRPSATIRPIDVHHTDLCGYRRQPREEFDPYVARLARQGAIRFEVAEATELGATEWASLKKMSVLVSQASQHAWIAPGQGFSLEPRAHWASCTMCHEEIVKHSAMVSVYWAGRTLSREYILTATTASAPSATRTGT